MDEEPMTPENFGGLLQVSRRVVSSEHGQMPRVCPRCGGKMTFKIQALVVGPKPGDALVYECEDCREKVERFFPFPEEYARHFKGYQEQQR